MEQDEAKDTFLNTAEVMGEKDTLLLNSSKVLRHGKVVSNGEEMTDLTDKIKSVCFLASACSFDILELTLQMMHGSEMNEKVM